MRSQSQGRASGGGGQCVCVLCVCVCGGRISQVEGRMSMTMCCSSGAVRAPVAVRASAGVRASSAVRFPGAVSAPGRVSLGAARSSMGRRGVVCMSAATDEIVDKLKSLTLLEASELVKQIEETFGVDASASAGVAVMAAPAAGGGGGAEASEEKTSWDVVLTAVDDSKRIGAIKAIRGCTSLGLKEAKDALDKLPFTVLEQANKEDCDKAKAALEEAGGKVEIK